MESRGEDATGADRAARFWGWDLFPGSKNSAAGVIVSEETCKTVAAVFAAVSIIAGALGTMPLVTFRKTGKHTKDPAESDSRFGLLSLAPNPQMTAVTFRETLMQYLLLWGNCYAEIERNASGKALALWPMHPNRVKPTWNRATATLEYKVRVEGREVTLQPENVFHIPGLGDGFSGESVIGHARTSLGLSIAADEFGASFFGNSAIPSVLLMHPNTLKKEAKENIRDSWLQRFGGPKKAQGVVVLEEGMKVEKISIPPEDAQFLQTRQHQVKDVANWFQIPSHMICGDEKPTYASVEQRFQEFVQLTLNRWMTKWEMECCKKILPESNLFCQFDTSVLLRGDTKTRYEAYNLAIQGGWQSREEVRAEENLNPAPGLETFLRPLNFVEVGKEPEPAPAPGKNAPGAPLPPASTAARDLRPMVEATWRRIIRAEVGALRKGNMDWSAHEHFVRQALEPLMPAVGLKPSEAAVLTAAHLLTLRSALEAAGNNGGRAALLDAWEKTKAAEKTSALLGDN